MGVSCSISTPDATSMCIMNHIASVIVWVTWVGGNVHHRDEANTEEKQVHANLTLNPKP